jgi:WD40 repeat protein
MDGMARVWAAEGNREVLTLKGHADSVTSAAFSPHGRRVVTASVDNTAKIWEAYDWKLSPEELEQQRRDRYRRRLEEEN